MRIQRYLLTALFSALLWPITLSFLGHPLVPVMQTSTSLFIVLLTTLAGSTIAGVWIVDRFSLWSAGTTPFLGFGATLDRFFIGLGAAVVFCIPYSRTIALLADAPFGYVDALETQGPIVVGVVWLAAIFVDLFVRKYGT